MAEATYIDTPEFPESLEEVGANGARGTRFYKVNTRDRVVALQAVGLPVYGDGWPGRSDLRVVRRQPVGGSGIWEHVRVDYETESLNGSNPSPTPGLLYSVLDFEYASATLRFDLEGVAFPEGQEPTVTRFQPALTVIHHRTTPLPASVALGLFTVFLDGGEPAQVSRSVVNQHAITVPKRLGQPDLSLGTTFPPGQMLLQGIQEEPASGIFIAKFRFWLAPDWRVPVRFEDEQGRPLTSVGLYPIYPAADFRGLWPGAGG